MALDRIIKVKHLLADPTRIGGLMMSPNTWYDVLDDAGRSTLARDGYAQSLIYSGDVIVSNGFVELYKEDAHNWITADQRKDLDGRPIFHATARYLGTYTYFTGSDDDHTDPHAIGGNNNVTDLVFVHNIGDSMIGSIYMDFNTIYNKTYVRQGDLSWKDAVFDILDFHVVPKVTPYSPGTNTNFNLYGGYLIIPAAGDGAISVDAGDMLLVQNTPNEYGTMPAGYWDADWNVTTKQFENIVPNISGEGAYNMFGTEVVLYNFMNRKILFGTGHKICPTDDASQIGHNVRLKITYATKGADHDWCGCGTLVLYRAKTA